MSADRFQEPFNAGLDAETDGTPRSLSIRKEGLPMIFLVVLLAWLFLGHSVSEERVACVIARLVQNGGAELVDCSVWPVKG